MPRIRYVIFMSAMLELLGCGAVEKPQSHLDWSVSLKGAEQTVVTAAGNSYGVFDSVSSDGIHDVEIKKWNADGQLLWEKPVFNGMSVGYLHMEVITAQGAEQLHAVVQDSMEQTTYIYFYDGDGNAQAEVSISNGDCQALGYGPHCTPTDFLSDASMPDQLLLLLGNGRQPVLVTMNAVTKPAAYENSTLTNHWRVNSNGYYWYDHPEQPATIRRVDAAGGLVWQQAYDFSLHALVSASEGGFVAEVTEGGLCALQVFRDSGVDIERLGSQACVAGDYAITSALNVLVANWVAESGELILNLRDPAGVSVSQFAQVLPAQSGEVLLQRLKAGRFSVLLNTVSERDVSDIEGDNPFHSSRQSHGFLVDSNLQVEWGFSFPERVVKGYQTRVLVDEVNQIYITNTHFIEGTTAGSDVLMLDHSENGEVFATLDAFTFYPSLEGLSYQTLFGRLNSQ